MRTRPSVLAAVVAAILIGLAGCGSSGGAQSPTTRGGGSSAPLGGDPQR